MRMAPPIVIVWLGLAVGLGAGCAATRKTDSPGLADAKAAETRVFDYLRHSGAVAPGAAIEVTSWQPAVVPGWTKGTLKVTAGPRSQQGTILVSNDGRYLLRGEPVDLTVDPLQAIRAKINLSNQPSRGPADAPVTVVEYSDFQCPYCAKASAIVEHDLLTAYPDKVRLVHKSFPLTNIHPWAMSAAIAARCAFEQNNEAYWVLYEAFFSEQKTITPANVKDKALAAARRTTIDLALFETCYDGKATAAAVQADVAEGNAVGVNSTPTFFVNGRRIAGAAPLESFRAAVDAELAAR